MRLRNYSSEGIVLSKRNYSESDRIIHVYSKAVGKTTLLAKGVRKLKSRKRGHLEVFSHILYHAAKSPGMDIVTEVETIGEMEKIRKSLKKVTLAYYFCEVVAKTAREEEKNPKIFNLLKDYLYRLKDEKELKKVRLQFISDLVVALGYWPEGKKLINPDGFLSGVVEKRINSEIVGKRILM